MQKQKRIIAKTVSTKRETSPITLPPHRYVAAAAGAFMGTQIVP